MIHQQFSGPLLREASPVSARDIFVRQRRPVTRLETSLPSFPFNSGLPVKP